MNDQSFRERIDRISGLVGQLEAAADPLVRTASKELAGAVMDLHATGLERVFEIVSRSGIASAGILESFARDPLVSSLLILHGLHPVDVETRARKALEGVPHAEFVSCEDGVLSATVSHGGEEAVLEALGGAAPDLIDVIIENPGGTGFVPVEALSGKAARVNP